VKPKCVWTRQHWQDMVESPGLADAGQTIGGEEFCAVLRCCLYRYHLDQLNRTLLDKHSSRELVSCARALKFLLIRQGPLRASQIKDRNGINGAGAAEPRSPASSVRQWQVASSAAPPGADDEVARQLKSMNDTMHMLLGKVSMMERELLRVRAAVCSNPESPRAGPASRDAATLDDSLASDALQQTPAHMHQATLGGDVGFTDAGAEQARAGATAASSHPAPVSVTASSMRDDVSVGAENGGRGATEDELPKGWRQYWSRSRSRHYYRNKITGQSSWARPSNDVGFRALDQTQSVDVYGPDADAGALSPRDDENDVSEVWRERERTYMSYSKRRTDAEEMAADSQQPPIAAGRRSLRGGRERAPVPGSSSAPNRGFAREETAMPEAQVAKLELGSGRRRQGSAPSLKLSPRGRYNDQHSRSAASVHSFERPSPRIQGNEPLDGPSLLQGVAGLGKSLSNMMGGGLSQGANGDKAKSWSRRKTTSELDSQRLGGALLSAADLRAVAAAGGRGQARAQWDEDDSFTQPQSPPGNSRLRVF